MKYNVVYHNKTSLYKIDEVVYMLHGNYNFGEYRIEMIGFSSANADGMFIYTLRNTHGSEKIENVREDTIISSRQKLFEAINKAL